MPVPLGTNEKFSSELYKAKGNPDHRFKQSWPDRWALVTGKQLVSLSGLICRPDLSQAVMKCSVASAAPMETHYNAVKSTFRYLVATVADKFIIGEQHHRWISQMMHCPIF